LQAAFAVPRKAIIAEAKYIVEHLEREQRLCTRGDLYTTNIEYGAKIGVFVNIITRRGLSSREHKELRIILLSS
jgi:hypothetical protein